MSDLVTLADLAAAGWTLAEVRRLDPAPTEYVALDGLPCWLRAELVPLLGEALEEWEPNGEG